MMLKVLVWRGKVFCHSNVVSVSIKFLSFSASALGAFPEQPQAEHGFPSPLHSIAGGLKILERSWQLWWGHLISDISGFPWARGKSRFLMSAVTFHRFHKLPSRETSGCFGNQCYNCPPGKCLWRSPDTMLSVEWYFHELFNSTEENTAPVLSLTSTIYTEFRGVICCLYSPVCITFY